MRGAGELQPAADHGTLQRGDDRHAAVLDAVEHAMPHLRMQQAFGGVALPQLRQIKPRGEIVAEAVNYHRSDVVRQIGEALADGEDDAVIECIALGRTVEAHSQHRALPFDLEQRGIGCGRWRLGVSHLNHCVLF